MITTWSNAVLGPPEINPDMIGGVVQGGFTPPNNGTSPDFIAKYETIDEITGTNTNGMNSIGLYTIGTPNNTGSLMLNIAGIILNLPIVCIVQT